MTSPSLVPWRAEGKYSMGYALKDKQAFLKEWEELLVSAQDILITTHIREDDDAIGSLLSLYSHLTRTYPTKKVKMAVSYATKPRWNQFKNFDLIQFDKDIADEIDQHDLLIIVDTANYDRVSYKPDILAASHIKKMCIDNHESTERDAFDAMCIDLDTVSVSEMVYELFYEQAAHILRDDAEAMMLGILGDSIWFTLNLAPKKVKVFTIVERLLREGQIDLETFKEKFWLEPSQTFLIMQNAMSHATFYEIPGWPKFLCSYIDREFVEKHKFSDADLSVGMSAYTADFNKTLSDVPWGISLYPQKDGSIKASLRSRPGSVNVRVIAETMGLGKGHDGASGMVFPSNGETLQPAEAVEEFLEFLKTHTPVKYEH